MFRINANFVSIVLVSLMIFSLFPARTQGKIQKWATKEDAARIYDEVWKLNKGQAEIKEQLAQIKALVESECSSPEETNAKLMARMDELVQEMLTLSEKLSDVNFRLTALATQRTTAQVSVSETETRSDSYSAADTPEKIYQSAYADYSKGNYSLAVMGFEEFLKRYPTSELADNALYWIGECRYAERNFEKAIEVFDQVIRDYPNGDKTSSAYLKKGYAYLELYQIGQGVLVLQGLIQQHPHSPEARLAKQKLEEIGVAR